MSSRAQNPIWTQNKVQGFRGSRFFVFVIYVLFMLVTSLVAYAYIYQQKQIAVSYRNEHARLQQELDALTEQERQIEYDLISVGTPRYAEQVARQELGMVKSDEIVFVEGGEGR